MTVSMLIAEFETHFTCENVKICVDIKMVAGVLK